MQTEILKSFTNEQIETEKRRLERKYESFENLQHRFSVNKCQNPDIVDDYMVWKALNEDNVTLTEKIILKNLDIYLMMSPKRMEIIDYLVSHSTKSIKELASDLKRNYKNVYDDIKALEKFDLLDLDGEGKMRRPTTKIHSIMIKPDR
jgi:hypothetical protein